MLPLAFDPVCTPGYSWVDILCVHSDSERIFFCFDLGECAKGIHVLMKMITSLGVLKGKSTVSAAELHCGQCRHREGECVELKERRRQYFWFCRSDFDHFF